MKITGECPKGWRAESDAHIMAEYQAIINDKSRREAAIKAANKQVKDLNARASAMSKVVNAGRKKSK